MGKFILGLMALCLVILIIFGSVILGFMMFSYLLEIKEEIHDKLSEKRDK